MISVGQEATTPWYVMAHIKYLVTINTKNNNNIQAHVSRNIKILGA